MFSRKPTVTSLYHKYRLSSAWIVYLDENESVFTCNQQSPLGPAQQHCEALAARGTLGSKMSWCSMHNA